MISVIILTKNEEDSIVPCMRSVSWCDEIIVVDDNSDDKTIELARKNGAKVFVHSLNNNFSEQRNFGLSKANSDWVLFLDADERVSSALWYEIMQQTSNSINDASGYYLTRKDTIWGKTLQHGETGKIRLLRLAKKNAGKWVGTVHEQWRINGTKRTLKNSLDHYPHQNVQTFLKEINYYTDLRALELFKRKISVSWWQIVVYPNAKFIMNYFLRLGFLDGIAGLLMAMHMSLHSFLVRAKLWLLWEKHV